MKCMCWVCWGDAERKSAIGDWQNIVCTGCGRYFISKRLIQQNAGKKFEVMAMRKVINDAALAGLVPAISDRTARFATASSNWHDRAGMPTPIR